jgi:hypothetical protein
MFVIFCRSCHCADINARKTTHNRAITSPDERLRSTTMCCVLFRLRATVPQSHDTDVTNMCVKRPIVRDEALLIHLLESLVFIVIIKELHHVQM